MFIQAQAGLPCRVGGEMPQRFVKTALIVALSALSLGVAAAGVAAQTQQKAPQEQEQANTKESDLKQLEEVVVQERADTPGTTVLSREEISMTPNGRGNIRDSLKGQSFIAFGAASRSSQSAAELFASKISIRGSLPFENHYSINGLNNTNMLKPADANGFQCIWAQAGGDSQSFMVSSDMVSEVDVLSENVSAEFGDFTGGSINAYFRDASVKNIHGKVWLTHSNDSLSQFHGPKPQDDFVHYEGGFRLEAPIIKDRLGAMISFDRMWSKFPQTYAHRDEKFGDVTRTNDNLLIKVNTDPKADHYVGVTFLHAPYTAQWVMLNTKGDGGDFDYKTGGWDLMVNMRNRLGRGVWKNDFSFNVADIKREYDGNTIWLWSKKLFDEENYEVIDSEYVDWDVVTPYAFEGARGDQTLTSKTIQWKSVFKLDPIETRFFTSHIKFGGEIQHVRAEGKTQGYTEFRNYFTHDEWGEDYYGNGGTMGLYTPSIEGDKSDGILAGEQFADEKTVVPGQTRKHNYTSAAAFFENRMTFGRVTLRPGLRLSWEDVTNEAHFAPRLFANVDVLDDGRFNVNAGFNRYYGTILQTLALTAPAWDRKVYHRGVDYYDDTEPSEWREDKNITVPRDRLGDIEMPYSDEFTLGASADVLDGTLFRIIAVKRDYHKQLRTRNFGSRTSLSGYDSVRGLEFYNGGETTYKGITLTVDKVFDFDRFGRHRVELGVTRAKTTGNARNIYDELNFDNSIDSYDIPDKILLDGKVVSPDDLPAADFNPKWTVTFAHNGHFFNDRLRTMTLVRYDGKASHLYKKGGAFYTDKSEARINVDVKAEYDFLKVYGTTVSANVQVMNVFNHENRFNTSFYNSKSKVGYGMGRQFYFGLSAEF